MAKDLTEALRALTEGAAGGSSRKDSTLPAAKPLPEIPAREGAGKPKSSGTGGIASPLVEAAYGNRTFYGYRTIYSTDGLFPHRVRLPSKLVFTDANDNPVEIRPADKT